MANKNEGPTGPNDVTLPPGLTGPISPTETQGKTGPSCPDQIRSAQFQNLKNEYFECICHSLDHLLVACLDRENNELYFEFHLSQYRNFFKRILVAIKYIFGYKSRYGCFDVFMLNNDDAERLIAILKELKPYKIQ